MAFLFLVLRMSFVLLNRYSNYIEANIALTMLQDAGINCHLEDENTVTLVNMYGGMRLMVYHSQAERAVEIIKDVEKEYLATIACPDCKNHTLEIKYVTKDYRKHLGGLLSFFSKLITKEGTNVQLKHYYCTTCKKEYEELPQSN
jgi:DNA-directed RNA polymerase subunit RPC12/RpoP